MATKVKKGKTNYLITDLHICIYKIFEEFQRTKSTKAGLVFPVGRIHRYKNKVDRVQYQ